MDGTKKRRKKIILSITGFAAVVTCVLVFTLKGADFSAVASATAGADPFFIAAAVACMCGFILCESLNIGRVLKAMGYKTGLVKNLLYGASGFFFSGITPSASGGQPMQLYYMSKNKIDVSHGSLSILTEVTGFQLINVSLAVFGIIYNQNYISGLGSGAKLLLYAGTIISALILAALITVLFCPGPAGWIEKRIKIICLKLNKKKSIRKVSRQMKEYRTGAVYIKKHPRLIVKNVITTAVQLTAMYSITYLVYCALGCSGSGWLQIFTLQAMLTAGVSVVPLPGGTGAGEGGFKMIFASIFSGNMLVPGMLLSRGLSFYLGMAVTGIFIAVLLGHEKINRRREKSAIII